ncbi:LytTR family two component transcriptional regulator [Hypnocyclicus thermotrophus]|uniref:LytTR family two component transcriptional regulator n=1 Tax=Hypnocyclicus thermotrophus TaxID=1627895 RepID=A0AA46DZQ8_9FUSO|nr:LytTR family DNA-binding domain-containing protein [Hypnocyclicus thermotrophus]TDT71587.1 LytTR family two component transcriptional regulator [Hypnocyclicus thermotrophus]
MNCIIVDDEFPSREELKYFINEFSNIEILDEFENPLEVIKFLKDYRIDIVFLDINMPGIDGMSLAEIIKGLYDDIKIVFITAYAEYAIDAFRVKAYDYILKPYSEETIIKCLMKLTNNEEIDEKKEKKNRGIDGVVGWFKEKMYVLDYDEILFIEACERESKIYTKHNIYIAKSKISDFEEKLPLKKFFRTHRSYIVNLEKIEEIIPWFNNTYKLKIKDFDEEVLVSRNNIKEFRIIMNMI